MLTILSRATEILLSCSWLRTPALLKSYWPPVRTRTLTNFEGATALHGAAERDNPEIIKMLIEHGAEVNAQQTGGALAGFTALAMT